MLRITPTSPSDPDARLCDFFAVADGRDFALHDRSNGKQVLIRAERRGARRVVDRYLLRPSGPKALDRTIFEIDASRFAELESYRSEAGPNLHRSPIVLPGTLRLNEWHEVHPGARVQLGFVGPALLQLCDSTVTRRVLCLVAQQGSEAREQWLAEGVGEIALAPRAKSPEQWLTAWRGENSSLLGEVPSHWCDADLPLLPAIEDSVPRQDLF